jgi:cyclic-di-GMP-binding protein
MAKEFSFDIVCRTDMSEVKNAVDQAAREIGTRFDFKHSVSEIELKGEELLIHSDDEYKLESVIDILHSKLVKRSISLKSLDRGKIEPAAKGTVRQTVTFKQGIPIDEAKKITKAIKEAAIKVTTQIQDEQVRITGKDKDVLQSVIALVKGMDLPIDVHFVNYR